jgi:diacylglycerol kinase (ATP)
MAKPGKSGLPRLKDALKYSWWGFKAAYKNEDAFRQECLIVVILVPSAFFLTHDTAERGLLLITAFLPMLTELMNSAIEAVVDRISDEHHELSGRAKDLGAAAVLLSLFILAFTWGLIAYSNHGHLLFE